MLQKKKIVDFLFKTVPEMPTPLMCRVAISSIASPGNAEEEIAASPLFWGSAGK